MGISRIHKRLVLGHRDKSGSSYSSEIRKYKFLSILTTALIVAYGYIYHFTEQEGEKHL